MNIKGSMKVLPTVMIGNKNIGENQQTYFIADIAANHDGDLVKAKELIYAAKDSGANAAKFQHFSAKSIVSDIGFKQLKGTKSHQSKWGKSVFEVYKDATVPQEWTQELQETCKKADIEFFTSPYSKDIVDHIDPYVQAFKIGSGDITWIELIKYIAKKQKPIIIACGASTMTDIERAVDATVQINNKLILMQCNTNYTGHESNKNFINLRVLNTLKQKYPGMILGLSDHTKTHTSVLGAIAMGAKIIEKHFTLNETAQGPDHGFSLTPPRWKEMMTLSRELESNLGDGIKQIEENEQKTVVLQRRAICAKHKLAKGKIIRKEDLINLRPCPEYGIPPYKEYEIIGKEINRDIECNHMLTYSDLEK